MNKKHRPRPGPSKAQPVRSPAKIPIVFEDAHILVVNKPAGLTTVRHAAERAEFGSRAERFLPATLVDVLNRQIPGSRLRAVHRLDKETSGLVVLARTAAAERELGLEFRAHDINRTYLALVRGSAVEATITSNLVSDRGDGRRGSSLLPTRRVSEGHPSTAEKGQRAVTHVRVVEKLAGFTLVECRLETGRTHQVRIHLGEQGTPLCGERIYDRPLHGRPVPDGSGADRPALHAATLAFDHPVKKKRMEFACPLPEDMRKLLERLRKIQHQPDA